jgi:hypothetical protein
LQVRFLPPQLQRKGKPMGDGSRLENGRAMSLEGSTPSLSAGTCPRGAAWSARHPVTVEDAGSNPAGDACRHGTQIGNAAKLKPWRSFVGSIPTRATSKLMIEDFRLMIEKKRVF